MRAGARGTVSANTAPPPRRRRPAPNERSRVARARLLTLSLFCIAFAAVAAGGWYYWQRERAPTVLVIGAGPFDSDAYQLMREVAEVVQRSSDRLRLDIRATRDPSENISRLNAHRIDLAVVRADTPVVADVRVVADLYPDYLHLIVRDDAPAWTVPEIVNTNIVIPEFGTDAFRTFWVVGDHYDLPIDKFRWRARAFSEAAPELLAGRINALFTVRSVRDRALLRLFEEAQLKRIKLRYIPIRQAEAISLKRPFLHPAVIPSGSFTGASPVPVIDTPTASVSRILVTREDVDDEAIRQLTEVLFEHRLDLTMRFALASAITAPDQTRGLSMPVHEGAEAFYERDEPNFLQANAEPLALLVTLSMIMLSALFTLRSRLLSTQKNRADTYNYRLLEIAASARATRSLSELRDLKKDLAIVLETVVVALDTDEVTDEGFQSFSLLWDSVRDQINDRIADLKERGAAEA